MQLTKMADMFPVASSPPVQTGSGSVKRFDHARVVQRVNSFKSVSAHDLQFRRPLPRGEIDLWRPLLRLWRGTRFGA